MDFDLYSPLHLDFSGLASLQANTFGGEAVIGTTFLLTAELAAPPPVTQTFDSAGSLLFSISGDYELTGLTPPRLFEFDAPIVVGFDGTSIDYDAVLPVAFSLQADFARGMMFEAQHALGLRLAADFVGGGVYDASLAFGFDCVADFTGFQEFDAAFGLLIDLDGAFVAPLPAAGQAWVMNAATFGHGMYENFAFNSLVKYHGEYYGSNAAGLFRLSGTDDAGTPIAARIVSGVSDMGVLTTKYVPEARLSCRADAGALTVAVIMDEETKRIYGVDTRSDKAGLHTKRVNGNRGLAKGLKGNQVQVEIANVDGADFEVAELVLTVNPTRRTA